MPIGPRIRRLFGPYERGVAELYRRMFVDLDNFSELMHSWVPLAKNILEVGCGEGAMTERIAKIYPTASVLAIDISPNVGRLFAGDSTNVKFCQETVESVARRQPASFDLVILADVMHHVPLDLRCSLMSAIEKSLTPRGHLLFKDWVISAAPIHWLCNFSDRRLTGDHVSYFTLDGFNGLAAEAFGPESILRSGTVQPWRNNVAVLVERSVLAGDAGKM